MKIRITRLWHNVTRNNRDRRRPYIFDYAEYDEEQFRSRYRVTKAGFRELLDIVRPEISAHNDRGKLTPIDIQHLLTLRFHATGTFQMACGDLCEISQTSASRIIKRVSEAIACMKNNYVTFPKGDMLDISPASRLRAKFSNFERCNLLAK